MNLFWPSLFWLIVWFVPLFVACAGLYWLFTLPLQRQERARFLLDLLENGFRHGHSAESTIEAISATQDRSVGVQFHLLAAHVRSGLAFTDALAQTPSLASPQVAAMLRVGEKLGDLWKVLPVCRGMLKDAHSQTRNAVNYCLLLALVGTPVVPLTMLGTREAVIPKIREIAESYQIDVPSTGMMTVFHFSSLIAVFQIIFAVLVCLGVVVYVGGPRLRHWTATVFPTLCDHLMYRVPWRRKRLRRDFAAMLALLLDAGVPEETSIKLAAAATANQIFVEQAERAASDLQAGMKLPEALRRFDREAEFAWRLSNAAHAPNGFSTALSGWIEALDAKAFQEEQTFSQIFSTGLVIANGVVVAMVVLGVFDVITSITDKVALW